ncbi:TauD/TfdA family dioxygenase [Pseudomonas sp. GV047]|uniref:TauD/TfdA family dioxygenase n=1 Tax=Pseudomonas sp. GV047 TaxID=2135751 RepID=UPI0035321906
MGNSEAGWHTDTWFYERPPAGALLRAVEVPPTGGDTYWLSADSTAIRPPIP